MANLKFSQLDLQNTTAISEYYQVHAIPQRFDAGIIVASIAVSLLGSYAALFVLGKRTGNSGVRNISLLVLAATTMAYVGIWSMHFIGMHMQLEATPTMKWYINYNPGFTVFSVLAPIMALIISFLFVENALFGFRYWKVILAGTLTGGTVAMMHYIASFHCNFLVSFRPAQVVVSILLACILCTVGLTAFFRFRSQWQDSWWKRGLCATVLAAGVATMHYVAVSGTSYRLRPENVGHLENLASGRRRNNILVIVIAVTSCVVVVGSVLTALSELKTTRNSRKKARKLVIASATFDRAGRLMVQSDGTLPLITIDELSLRRSQVVDALDQRSRIFQWLYAVSWKWEILTPFLDSIGKRVLQMEKQDYCVNQRQTLTRSQKARRVLSSRPNFAHSSTANNQDSKRLLDLRDKIVYAAHRLATDLEVPLTDLGIFYDQVLATGTKKAAETAAAKEAYRKRLNASFPGATDGPSARKTDDEASIGNKTTSVFGEGVDESEGVTLFVVREVTPEVLMQLSKRGFRFTETRFLSNVLADRHAVIKEEMESTLEALQLYAKRGTRPVVQPNGVYVGLFGVRPNSSHENGGLEVLVYNFARHQVPAYRLPSVARLTSEMIAFLRLVDQMSMSNVIKVCEQEWRKLAEERSSEMETHSVSTNLESKSSLSIKKEVSPEEELMHFYRALMVALEALQNSITFYSDLVNTARISCDVLEVPSSLAEGSAPAKMILVQAVLPSNPSMSRRGSTNDPSAGYSKPSNSKLPAGTPFVFTPYTLFAKSQMMMLRGPTAAAFEAEVAEELKARSENRSRSMKTEKRKTITEEDGRLSDMLSEKSMNTSSKGEPQSPSEGPRRPTKTSLMFPKMSTKHFNLSPLPRPRMGSISRQESEVKLHQSPTSPVSPSAVEEKEIISTTPPVLTPGLYGSSPKESYGIRRFTLSGRGNPAADVVDQTRFARPLGEHSPSEFEMDDETREDDGQAVASSIGHALQTPSSTPGPAKKGLSPKAPNRSSSKSGDETKAVRSRPLLSLPTARPSTAQASGSRQVSPVAMRPQTSGGSTPPVRRPDDWQSRQLEELEKNQPNLLLGIMPSEY